MPAEQGILVAGVDSLETGAVSVGVTQWGEPSGIDSIVVGAYGNVGSPANAIRFQVYPPQPSIDIAWLWSYQPPGADAAFVVLANGVTDREMVVTGSDQLQTEPWQAGPTQYAEPDSLDSLEFGYPCLRDRELPTHWQLYPPSSPIQLGTYTCYAPPHAAGSVVVSYSAQDRETLIPEGATFLETGLPLTQSITITITEVEATDQQQPGLPTVTDPSEVVFYPPRSAIVQRWTRYYQPTLQPVSYGGAWHRGALVPGDDSFESGPIVAMPTQFMQPEGIDSFLWSHATAHFPLFFGWFIYPPPPSVVIRFFDGWRKPLLNGSINLSALYQIDPYQPLATLVRSGDEQTQYDVPWIGAARLLVPGHDSFAADIPALTLPVAQHIGSETGPGMLLTEYGEPELMFYGEVLVGGADQFGAASPHVTRWIQQALPPDHSSFAFGPITLGTDRTIDGAWTPQFEPGFFTVGREPEIVPTDSNQLQTDRPSLSFANVAVLPGDEFFAPGNDAQVINLTRIVQFNGFISTEIDWPLIRNSDWHIVPDSEPPRGTMTLYPLYNETSVVNAERAISPLALTQTQSDGWDHNIRHGLTAVVPGLASLSVGNVDIKHWEQYFSPEGTVQFRSGMFPALRNAGQGVVPNGTMQTEQGMPWVIDGERKVFPWTGGEQTLTALPIVGQPREVTQILRLTDVQTEYGVGLVADAERTLVVESRADDPALRPRWSWQIERRVIDFEKYAYDQFQPGGQRIAIHGVDLGGGVFTEYGSPLVDALNKSIEVATSTQTAYGPIGFIKQEDVTVGAFGFSQTQWSAADVRSDLVVPVDPTQYIYHPRDMRFDTEIEVPPPETLYGDIGIKENIIIVTSGDEQTAFGTDWRIDFNILDLFEGKRETEYGWAEVTYFHREIKIAENNAPLTETGKPVVFDNVLRVREGISFTNCAYQDIAGARGCNNSPPSIENQHRVIVMSAPGDTIHIPELPRYGELALTLQGGLNYVNIALQEQLNVGYFEMWPYQKRIFVSPSEQTETEEPEITLPDPAARFDQTIGITGVSTLDSIQIGVELFHREVQVSERVLTAYGNNYPMIHFDFKLEPEGFEATRTGAPWIAYDPQERPIEGFDQAITWYDSFDDQLRVEERPQHIVPLGRDTLLTARPRVTR